MPSFSSLPSTRLIAAIAVLVASASPGLGEERTPRPLTVATNFPGGSGEVVAIDAAKQSIHLRPAVVEGRGWPCWWYVRIDGLETGKPVTVRVSAAVAEYRPGAPPLDGSWSLPDRAAVSLDDVAWSQTPPCVRIGRDAAEYVFDAPAGRVWLAWGPPFVPEQAEALLASVERTVPGAERFVLAKTREGRDVPGIRFGGDDEAARFGIWVQARQHAWEAGSSWVGQGFVEWAASDDPAAVELRRVATIHFVPILDVDSVAAGLGGKEAVPRDHNRDWTDEPTYPEVAAAQRRIVELDGAGRLDLFLDLHNPGASSRRPYFYGPHDLSELSAIEQRNYADFLSAAAKAISGPLPVESEWQIATYLKTDEERRRVSSNWVRDRASSHVVSTTLETAWNTPDSTQSGYRTVGRQLAQAVAAYLAQNPRRE